MSQIQDPPILGRLLESVINRLPDDAVSALAKMPGPSERSGARDPIDELIQLLQVKAKARLDEILAGPLADEPNFNEETLEAIRDVDTGVGVTRYKNAGEMFADLDS
jgi:hypothetical protein